MRERIHADGQVIEPLDLAQARIEVEGLVAAGVTSLAVCLLHSYVNATHEQQQFPLYPKYLCAIIFIRSGAEPDTFGANA